MTMPQNQTYKDWRQSLVEKYPEYLGGDIRIDSYCDASGLVSAKATNLKTGVVDEWVRAVPEDADAGTGK